ncbi:MAG: hypothetical protein ACAF41_14295 [Leptolyngbya sp. BL-A-14]
MNSSAFEKVLLCAILTSCTVFSVLMVAFIPRRPQPITIDPPDRLESTEDINHRDLVIRHIGMSIVVSVGAGITTAELIRKRGQWRETAKGKQVFSAQAMLQAVAPNFAPELALPGDGFTASLRDITTDDSARFEPQAFHQQTAGAVTGKPVSALDQPELAPFLFQPTAPLQSEDINWFLPLQSDTPSAELALDAPLQETDWQPTSHLILASHEQYQTCRISLPDVPERVLAICFDEQYYRFVKLVTEEEQALHMATKLDQRGETTIVTQVDDRYAVWAMDPEACPEAIEFLSAVA